MADPPVPVSSPRSTAVRVRGHGRGRTAARRRMREAETSWLVALVALAVFLMVGAVVFTSWWPLAALVIPLVLAMNTLSTPRLVVLELVVAACLVAVLAVSGEGKLRWSAACVVVVVGIIILWYANRRARLGMASTRGASMLVDLRDRLATQGQLPALPRGWQAEAVTRSAGGASFAGDFIVAAKTHSGDMLEVVVVDVSGKGVNAGTRALLLSGAFGGLLGSLSQEEFLPAANDYLLRQEWSEGFATAVHLALDLKTGDFQVWTAGHPPAVQFHAGSGRWSVHWTEGPVLGLVHHAEFTTYRGRMLAGDVLMLYTDGLVETPQRDITYGIDKLVGEAERLVQRGFDQGAKRLVQSVESEGDDRALFFLHRR